MDREVGEILEQLKEDGLAENTIVFFFSDHGSGMPRHKRALLDSGMHVPLLVRFPQKWKHLAPLQPGEKSQELVSFVDFGPTVLDLTDTSVPSLMQENHFSEPIPQQIGNMFMDIETGWMRSGFPFSEDEKYLYIRNYMPHLEYNQPTAWPILAKSA